MFVKFKSITMILLMLMFLFGIAEFIMVVMKFEIPKPIAIITTILLFICSMLEFIRVRKLKKLGYPLVMIYFLVWMPNMDKFTNSNNILDIGFVVLGFVITIVFLYSELKIVNKEKAITHK